jgi:hypothetical protein
MVDHQRPLGWFFAADGADAPLRLQQRPVLFERDAVAPFQVLAVRQG